MIANVSCASSQWGETRETLTYAHRAANITTAPTRQITNRFADVFYYKELVKNLEVELNDLKRAFSENQSQMSNLTAYVSIAKEQQARMLTAASELEYIEQLRKQVAFNTQELVDARKSFVEVQETNECNKETILLLDAEINHWFSERSAAVSQKRDHHDDGVASPGADRACDDKDSTAAAAATSPNEKLLDFPAEIELAVREKKGLEENIRDNLLVQQAVEENLSVLSRVRKDLRKRISELSTERSERKELLHLELSKGDVELHSLELELQAQLLHRIVEGQRMIFQLPDSPPPAQDISMGSSGATPVSPSPKRRRSSGSLTPSSSFRTFRTLDQMKHRLGSVTKFASFVRVVPSVPAAALMDAPQLDFEDEYASRLHPSTSSPALLLHDHERTHDHDHDHDLLSPTSATSAASGDRDGRPPGPESPPRLPNGVPPAKLAVAFSAVASPLLPRPKPTGSPLPLVAPAGVSSPNGARAASRPPQLPLISETRDTDTDWPAEPTEAEQEEALMDLQRRTEHLTRELKEARMALEDAARGNAEALERLSVIHSEQGANNAELSVRLKEREEDAAKAKALAEEKARDLEETRSLLTVRDRALSEMMKKVGKPKNPFEKWSKLVMVVLLLATAIAAFPHLSAAYWLVILACFGALLYINKDQPEPWKQMVDALLDVFSVFNQFAAKVSQFAAMERQKTKLRSRRESTRSNSRPRSSPTDSDDSEDDDAGRPRRIMIRGPGPPSDSGSDSNITISNEAIMDADDFNRARTNSMHTSMGLSNPTRTAKDKTVSDEIDAYRELESRSADSDSDEDCLPPSQITDDVSRRTRRAQMRASSSRRGFRDRHSDNVFAADLSYINPNNPHPRRNSKHKYSVRPTDDVGKDQPTERKPILLSASLR